MVGMNEKFLEATARDIYEADDIDIWWKKLPKLKEMMRNGGLTVKPPHLGLELGKWAEQNNDFISRIWWTQHIQHRASGPAQVCPPLDPWCHAKVFSSPWWASDADFRFQKPEKSRWNDTVQVHLA